MWLGEREKAHVSNHYLSSLCGGERATELQVACVYDIAVLQGFSGQDSGGHMLSSTQAQLVLCTFFFFFFLDSWHDLFFLFSFCDVVLFKSHYKSHAKSLMTYCFKLFRNWFSTFVDMNVKKQSNFISALKYSPLLKSFNDPSRN